MTAIDSLAENLKSLRRFELGGNPKINWSKGPIRKIEDKFDADNKDDKRMPVLQQTEGERAVESPEETKCRYFCEFIDQLSHMKTLQYMSLSENHLDERYEFKEHKLTGFEIVKQLLFKRVFQIVFEDLGSPTDGSPLVAEAFRSAVTQGVSPEPKQQAQSGKKLKKIRLKFFNDKIFKHYIISKTMENDPKRNKKRLAVIDEDEPAGEMDEEQPQDMNMRKQI